MMPRQYLRFGGGAGFTPPILGAVAARQETTTLGLANLPASLPDDADRLVVAGGAGSLGVAARTANRRVPLALIPPGPPTTSPTRPASPRDTEDGSRLAATSEFTVNGELRTFDPVMFTLLTGGVVVVVP